MPYSAKTNWRNNDIVTPDDLNRIEQGLADVASPKDDIILYVSAAGDDNTGTGDMNSPFRTVQKAIDALPPCNALGKACVIKIYEGEFAGFTLSAFKQIDVVVQGIVQFKGDIIINSGSMTFVDETDAQVYLIDARLYMNGGKLTSFIPIGITTSAQSSQYNGIAINCANGSIFGVHADTTITHHTTAISCSHSYINLKRMLTDQTSTGIVCECGITQLGDDVIQASTKFVTRDGGRIYVGAQTNVPNY